MLRIVDKSDIRLAEAIGSRDPFQLAPPFWLSRPNFDLWDGPNPLEVMRPTKEQQLRKEIETIMAIHMVAEREAPERMHGRGKVSSSQEYRDVLAAIKQIPDGKAIVVTIENDELKKVKKPETTFAYAIRRYLASHNIAATAYQSGKLEVVIRRDAQGSAPKKRKS